MDENSNRLRMEGEFSYVHDERVKYVSVRLSENCLEMCSAWDKTTIRAIDYDDLMGCMVEQSNEMQDEQVYLVLNVYTRESTAQQGKKALRKQVCYRLAYGKHDNRAENLQAVNKWHACLSQILNERNDYDNKRKPFLTFVNPNSGSGKAGGIFLRHAVNIWHQSNVCFETIITEYQNHARDVVMTKDLSKYRGIVVVSGDGLIHEILNGLLKRSDWQTAIRTPIGQIPAGSANGLASSVSYCSQEEFQINKLELFSSTMAFMLSKLKPNPMDLIFLQLADGSFKYSFMNIEWAIVADVDHESERFRFLGGLRFVLGFLIRILNLRVYRARISFLPFEDENQLKFKDSRIKLIKNNDNYSESENKTRLYNQELDFEYKHLKPIDQPVPNEWLTVEEDVILFLVVNLPAMGMDFLISPISTFDDGFMLLSFVRKGITKPELLKFLLQCSQGTILQNPSIEYVKAKAFRLEPLTSNMGTIMVDGEAVLNGPIQGEVVPKLGQVFRK